MRTALCGSCPILLFFFSSSGIYREDQSVNARECAMSMQHPSETAMVRQQLTPKGQAILPLDKMLKQLYRTEGFGGLYRGIGAATVREMTYSTLRFGLYEPIAIQLDASNVEANSIFGAVRISVQRITTSRTHCGVATAAAFAECCCRCRSLLGLCGL
eukprot:SAG31_NODE_645_length_13244_cov_11.768903_7_plen_158_part_00